MAHLIKTLIHEKLINKYNQLALCKQETATNMNVSQLVRLYEKTTENLL